MISTEVFGQGRTGQRRSGEFLLGRLKREGLKFNNNRGRTWVLGRNGERRMEGGRGRCAGMGVDRGEEEAGDRRKIEECDQDAHCGDSQRRFVIIQVG